MPGEVSKAIKAAIQPDFTDIALTDWVYHRFPTDDITGSTWNHGGNASDPNIALTAGTHDDANWTQRAGKFTATAVPVAYGSDIITNAPSLDIATLNCVLAVRVNFPCKPAATRSVVVMESTDGGRDQLNLDVTASGLVRLGWGEATKLEYVQFDASAVIFDDQEHLITVFLSGNNNVGWLFIDGVLRATQDLTAWTNYANVPVYVNPKIFFGGEVGSTGGVNFTRSWGTMLSCTAAADPVFTMAANHGKSDGDTIGLIDVNGTFNSPINGNHIITAASGATFKLATPIACTVAATSGNVNLGQAFGDVHFLWKNDAAQAMSLSKSARITSWLLANPGANIPHELMNNG